MQTTRGASLSDASENGPDGSPITEEPPPAPTAPPENAAPNDGSHEPLGADRGTDGPSHRRGREAVWLFGTVAAITVVADQVTKALAAARLDPDRPTHVVDGVLRLHLARNAGAAFSTGRGYTVVLSIVALGVIAFILRVARSLRSRGWALALGLILGGALGNVTDRLFRAPGPLRGQVVDFLELPHWPIFNVADMAITSAAVLFVWLSLRGVGLDGRSDPGARDGD